MLQCGLLWVRYRVSGTQLVKVRKNGSPQVYRSPMNRMVGITVGFLDGWS